MGTIIKEVKNQRVGNPDKKGNSNDKHNNYSRKPFGKQRIA